MFRNSGLKGIVFPPPPGIELEDFLRLCHPFTAIRLKENDCHVRLIRWNGSFDIINPSSIILKVKISDYKSLKPRQFFFIKVGVKDMNKNSFFFFYLFCFLSYYIWYCKGRYWRI
jgi:hypothetical protein